MPARPDRYPATTWRKSSASADQGTCVEVAARKPFVLVRDSRNADGATLEILFDRWRELMKRIRNGQLDCG
ncbi:MAG: DUF397 domain-containing protein [Streptosporangiaceae bacterium]